MNKVKKKKKRKKRKKMKQKKTMKKFILQRRKNQSMNIKN
jgi:hypothetical protein